MDDMTNSNLYVVNPNSETAPVTIALSGSDGAKLKFRAGPVGHIEFCDRRQIVADFMDALHEEFVELNHEVVTLEDDSSIVCSFDAMAEDGICIPDHDRTRGELGGFLCAERLDGCAFLVLCIFHGDVSLEWRTNSDRTRDMCDLFEGISKDLKAAVT